jgi:hypothetical protein
MTPTGTKHGADLGLYDSATGKSLEVIKTVDVTAEQTRATEALMLFTEAKRGRIVQFRSDGMRIHYFLDEPSGHEMMTEDAERFGFAPGRFHILALHHAPEPTAKAERPHV